MFKAMWKTVLLGAIFLYCYPVIEGNRKQSGSKGCLKTNKLRYCGKTCLTDGDCRRNHKCLCDGDCGMICVKNNLKCAALPKVNNGRQTFTKGNNFKSVVTCVCMYPYKRRGSATRTCRATGKWDGEKARCSFMTCDKPVLLHGSTILHPSKQEKYTYGSVVLFGCTVGFYLVGNPVIKCKGNKWTKMQFRCLASCPAFGSIANGVITHVTWKDGSEVRIKCTANYKLVGPSKKKSVNGKWNDRLPSCKDYSQCGTSPIRLRARLRRMVGGKNSKKGWWPWMIGLRRLNSKMENVLICGGSLISRRWVLTAAHCFYHKNFRGARVLDDLSNKYQVTVGDHHLQRVEKSQMEVEVEKIFVHQNYADDKFANDIALVKLGQKVELGRFVQTLCIPEKDEGDSAIPRKFGIATGWGVTQALKLGEMPREEKRYSARLQYSAFTIQSDKLCANKSAEYFFNSTVMFCAGEGNGGNDTCQGDTGGAFVREVKRGDSFRWVATGLISWGVGCAQKDQYGYYTRVYPFIDWIKKTMRDNS